MFFVLTSKLQFHAWQNATLGNTITIIIPQFNVVLWHHGSLTTIQYTIQG